MLEIKYLWLYVIILLSSAGGYGLSHVASPSNAVLERQLFEARMEIEDLKKRCLPTLKREPVRKGSGRSL